MEMRIRESNGTFKVTVLSLAGQELSIYREISGGLTFELREVEGVEEVAAFKMEAIEALQKVVEEVALLDVGTLEVVEEVALSNEGTLEVVEEVALLNEGTLEVVEKVALLNEGTLEVVEKVVLLNEETLAEVEGIATQEESEEEAIKKEARNNAIFHKLSDLRRQLAKTEKVPPFLVFHDKTLWGIVENMPSDLTALKKISGVGNVKLEKYGKQFLSVLQEAV